MFIYFIYKYIEMNKKMDEIDLGLHNLTNELGIDVNKEKMISSVLKTEARYIYMLKTFFFYWMTAVILFIFLLWASPEYFYENYGSQKRFLWQRFFKVFLFLYILIIFTYMISNYFKKVLIFP